MPEYSKRIPRCASSYSMRKALCFAALGKCSKAQIQRLRCVKYSSQPRAGSLSCQPMCHTATPGRLIVGTPCSLARKPYSISSNLMNTGKPSPIVRMVSVGIRQNHHPLKSENCMLCSDGLSANGSERKSWLNSAPRDGYIHIEDASKRSPCTCRTVR